MHRTTHHARPSVAQERDLAQTEHRAIRYPAVRSVAETAAAARAGTHGHSRHRRRGRRVGVLLCTRPNRIRSATSSDEAEDQRLRLATSARSKQASTRERTGTIQGRNRVPTQATKKLTKCWSIFSKAWPCLSVGSASKRVSCRNFSFNSSLRALRHIAIGQRQQCMSSR
jgi:hypothetical protein